MNQSRPLLLSLLALLLMLAGCATRPVNPPITQADPNAGYAYQTRQQHFNDWSGENLVVLAFSGGGTRAAAFSYGVLEFLRSHDALAADGKRTRLLDTVDIITGVSGGSFTALAYGLYGDKLFDLYEAAFLKRDVQGELLARIFNPGNWGNLLSTGWGRSELAAQLYDEILFKGATFGDLDRRGGPLIMASATDVSNGGRVVFHQISFNRFCSDLDVVPLSRAAAASSAAPVLLSTVTINNYGGTCNNIDPPWMTAFADSPNPPQSAARAMRVLRDAEAYSDSVHHPYIHLVDGGVSDNLAMRSVLDTLSLAEALHDAGRPSPLDHARRILVFVVNALSSIPKNWNASESGPAVLEVLLQASSVPIDYYSYESVDLLNDIAARWKRARRLRDLAGCATQPDAPICAEVRPPQAEIIVIDVSFAAHPDKAERDYLNLQPTSFVLPAEAVDRLRAAAGATILASPELHRLLRETGVKLVPNSAADASTGIGAD